MQRRRQTRLGRFVRWLPWWALVLVVAGAVGAARFWPAYAVSVLVAFGVSAIGWRVYRWRRAPTIRDWQDAEHAAAVWLRRNGGRRVHLSGAGPDGGVDVITRDLAVQVKHIARRVGRPTLQQTVGAALTLDRAPVVFSTSGFSAPAVAYADEHDVAIFELYRNGDAAPMNQTARRLGRRF